MWVEVVTFRAPALTGLVLAFFIPIWAMAAGFLRIVTAVSLRKIVSGSGLAIVQRHILGAGRVNACVADRRLS